MSAPDAVKGGFSMLEILYENEDCYLCRKDPGMTCGGGGARDILTALTAYGGAPVYPVHRLDTGTGGVYCVARTSSMAARLSLAFSRQGADSVHKEYLCVVSGCPEQEEGVMEDLLLYLPSAGKSFVTNRARHGTKLARLSYRVLRTSECNDAPCSLVRAVLETGRTHQVRVQFASRKMPLFGDRKYGSREKCTYAGIALWSHRLVLPGGIEAVCPPPAVHPWSLFAEN